MASNFDITKILKLIAEDEEPAIIERFAKKLVEKYPQKAAMLIKRLSLEKQFKESYVTVTSAHALPVVQKQLIEKVLGCKSNQKIEITYLINEELLGGVVIRMGETVMDNSLRNRVTQLTDYIKQTKMGVGA